MKKQKFTYYFSAPGQMHGFSLIIFFMLLIISYEAVAQDPEIKPSRETAERFYSTGDFTNALIHYNLLKDKFPADPLYKYYAAVCMVKIEMDPGMASELLSEAIENSSQIRNVPPDGWFYLGRAYQLSGYYDEAGVAYDMFREKVRRKEAREYDVDRYINECYNNVTKSPVQIDDTIKVSDINIVNDTVIKLEAVTIKSEAVPIKYDVVVRAALDAQFKADSLSRLANRYRKNLNMVSGSDRESVRSKILELEELLFICQSEADRKFANAARLNSEIFVDTENSEPARPDIIEIPDDLSEKRPGNKTDTDKLADTNYVADLDVHDSVTVKVDTVLVTVEPEPEPILIMFNDKTVQPASIPVNSKMPEGLYYRIQAGAFRNPVDPEFFKNIGPVYGLKAENSEITFYFVGLFRKKGDADGSLVKVRNKGFRDAFVIPVIDGKRVSFEKAASLEKKWGGTALVDSVPGNVKTKVKPAEPMTLVYRVEVKKSTKPLKEDELERFIIVAGERDFDILENNEGKEYTYLIGKFITFESAQTYSDLLFRNGIVDAHVVAYLGTNEFPLDKAKELFDLKFEK